MYEEQFIVTMWIAAFLALWVVKLKFANRKLRRQVASQAAAASLQAPAPPPPPLAAAPALMARDPEVERLRERVAVLERITVEKEHSLAREIDELRAR